MIRGAQDWQWCAACGHAEHYLDVCGQVDVDPERDWATCICRCYGKTAATSEQNDPR